MTIREIIARYPHLFYAQSWYDGESFVDRPEAGSVPADFRVYPDRVALDPVYAVDLAALYVTCPQDRRWRRFLWTDDTDRFGNRVYVGGVGVYGIEAFQLHRILRPDQRWGYPA